MTTTINSPVRSGSGRIRNLAAMGDAKLEGVISDMAGYATIDPEGYAAATAEAESRGLPVPPPADPAAPPEPEGLTFEPQKAAPTKADPAKLLTGSADRFMEYKFDGWRMVAVIDLDGQVELYARTGTRLTDHLPHITALLAEHVPPGTILDGEAGVKTDQWGEVQGVLSGYPKPPERAGQVGFYVFDCVQAEGEDLMGSPIGDRHVHLDRILDLIPASTGPVAGCWPVPRFDATESEYQRIVSEGFEGAVIKKYDSIYRPGTKGGGWTKLKVVGTEDVVLMSFVAGEGERGKDRLLGSIEFGQYVDGQLVSRGHVGGGFDDETARWLWDNQANLIGRVAEISHFGIGDGFRHPQWVRLRDSHDKAPEECLWS